MPGPRVIEAALRLRASLDAVAGALSQPDLAGLVAAEADLAAALADIGSVRTVDRADRHALAAELILARAALSRCRVLGAVATDAAKYSLAAQGRADDYGRSGNTAAALPLRGLDFDTRF
jgi:hypothetical protein